MTQASEVVKTLKEGDVISITQYQTPLRVTNTSDLNEETNACIGLEFTENQTSAEKMLIVNQYSGRVYLITGTTDKGEVTEIELKVSADEDDAQQTGEKITVASDGGLKTEIDESEPTDAESDELTGADTPEIGTQLDEYTHYAHTRYAARDESGIVWYDPRDGREYLATGASSDDLDTVGERCLTSVVINPNRSISGDPVD